MICLGSSHRRGPLPAPGPERIPVALDAAEESAPQPPGRFGELRPG